MYFLFNNLHVFIIYKKTQNIQRFSQFYYSYSFFVLSFLCGIYFLCFYCDFFLELVLEFSLLVGSLLLEIFHLLFTEFPLLRGLLTISCLEGLSDQWKLRLILFYLYFLLCDKIYANFLRFIGFFIFFSYYFQI